jgi:hypothetical protein
MFHHIFFFFIFNCCWFKEVWRRRSRLSWTVYCYNQQEYVHVCVVYIYTAEQSQKVLIMYKTSMSAIIIKGSGHVLYIYCYYAMLVCVNKNKPYFSFLCEPRHFEVFISDFCLLVQPSLLIKSMAPHRNNFVCSPFSPLVIFLPCPNGSRT